VAPDVDPDEAPRAPSAMTLLMLGMTGFYGGFLQAGVGFVLLTVLAGTLRLDLTRANALKVALVVPYTLVALGIFAWADQVAWGVGGLLGVTSMLGARLGVYVAMERAGWLRWLVLGTVVASGITMTLKRFV
jgi:uncharacterized membrane protein YfcA